MRSGRPCTTATSDRITHIFSDVGPDEAKRLANLTDRDGEPILHVAIKKNLVAVFDELSNAGADLTARDGPKGSNEALPVAAMYGTMAISKRILKKGIKPAKNAQGSWPSQLAAKYNHTEACPYAGIGGGRGTYTSRGRGQCCQTKQNNRGFGARGGEKAGKHERRKGRSNTAHSCKEKMRFPYMRLWRQQSPIPKPWTGRETKQCMWRP